MNAEKWHHSEIRIAINDESQGRPSVAKNLRCNELLYYIFITHSILVKEFLRLVNNLAKLRAKSLTESHYPIRLALLSSKMLISPDKLNNLCITDRNCY